MTQNIGAHGHLPGMKQLFEYLDERGEGMTHIDKLTREQVRKHELKTWPEYYQAVCRGEKTFEVRKNDRDYRVGDKLILREYDPTKCDYTGNWILVHVKYILDDPNFVKDGYVWMGIDKTALLAVMDS